VNRVLRKVPDLFATRSRHVLAASRNLLPGESAKLL
jgi:hypothetical protein